MRWRRSAFATWTCRTARIGCGRHSRRRATELRAISGGRCRWSAGPVRMAGASRALLLEFQAAPRRLRRPEPTMKRLQSLFARPIVRIVCLQILVAIAVALILLRNQERLTAHSGAQPIAASEAATVIRSGDARTITVQADHA